MKKKKRRIIAGFLALILLILNVFPVGADYTFFGKLFGIGGESVKAANPSGTFPNGSVVWDYDGNAGVIVSKKNDLMYNIKREDGSIVPLSVYQFMIDMEDAAQGTDMSFNNHEKNGNIMKDGDGNSIPGITGSTFARTSNMGVNGYTALQLLEAEAIAESQGKSLKLYEGYHPAYVTDDLYEKGHAAGISTQFLSSDTSAHEYGLAVDIALCDGSGNVLTDSGRSIYLLGDTSHISNNGTYSNTLYNIMTSVGMQAITNETMWWHFQTADAGRNASSYGSFTSTSGTTINFELNDYVDRSSSTDNGLSLDDMSDVSFTGITYPGYVSDGTESGPLTVTTVYNSFGQPMKLGTDGITASGSDHQVRNFYLTVDGKKTVAFCSNFGLHGRTGFNYELEGDREYIENHYTKNVSDLLCLTVYCYNNMAGSQASSDSPDTTVQSYRALTQAFIWTATSNDTLTDAVITDPDGTYETIDSSTNITNSEYFISLALYNLITGQGDSMVFTTIERAVHQAANGNTAAFSEVSQKLAYCASINPSALQTFILGSKGYYSWISGNTNNVAVKRYHDGVIDGSIDKTKLNIWLWSTHDSANQEMITYFVREVPMYVVLEVNKVDKDGNTLSADDMQYIKFTATYEGFDYAFTPDTANSKFTLNLTGLLGAPIDSGNFPITIKVKESYTDAGLALAENTRPKIDENEYTYELSLTSDGVRPTEAEALAEPYNCTNILGFSDGTFVNDIAPSSMSLKLYKVDEESMDGIVNDAEFAVVDDSGNEYVYTDRNGTDHPVEFHRVGRQIYVSDEIIYDKEDEGSTLYVVEKTAPENYYGNWSGSAGSAGSLDGKVKYAFTLTNGEVTELNNGEPIVNVETKAKITLHKKDIESNTHLADYTDGVSHMTGTLYGLFADGDIAYPDAYRGKAFSSGDLVAVSAVDEDGELVFDDLYLGNYKVKELYVDYGNDHKHMAISLKDADGNFVTGKVYYHDWEDMTLKSYGTNEWNAFCESGVYTRNSNKYTTVDGTKNQYEHLDFTGYYADYVDHEVSLQYDDESVDLVTDEVTSYEQIPKAKFSFFKETSSEISDIGKPLEGAGFTIYRIDQLSKYNDNWVNSDGSYNVAAIRNSYLAGSSVGRHLDENNNWVTVDIYDFTQETDAIATFYVNDNNTAQVTSFDDGSGTTMTRWYYAEAQQDLAEGKITALGNNKYRVNELYSDEYGRVTCPYLPYGEYIIVETKTPDDYEQTLPFIMQLYSHEGSAKVSDGVDEDTENGKTLGLSDPDSTVVKDANSIYEAWYSYKYTVEDKPVTMRLFLHKYDDDTKQEVFKDGAQYNIYRMDKLVVNGKTVTTDSQFDDYKAAHPRLTFTDGTDSKGNPTVRWSDLDYTGYSIDYELRVLNGVYYRTHIIENEADELASSYDPDKHIFVTKKLINTEGFTTGVYFETQQLEVGNYLVEEVSAPNGFYNDPDYFLTFKVTTGREYDIEVKLNSEHSRDYTFAEHYFDKETRGRIVLYKKGEVLTGATKNNVTDTNLLNAIDANSATTYDFTYEERYVPGAIYYIYADEDIFTQDANYERNADGSVKTTTDAYGYTVPVYTTWFKEGDLVAVVNTAYANEDTEEQGVIYDGTAAGCDISYDALTDTYSAVYHGQSTGSYNSEASHPVVKVTANTEGKVTVDLPLGTYHIVEKTAPLGMTISSESYKVGYTWVDDDTPYVYTDAIDDGTHNDVVYRGDNTTEAAEYRTQGLVWTNDRVKAKAEAYKVLDGNTNVPLRNVTIGLYTYNNIYDYRGKIIVEANELSPALIGYATSDANGKLEFSTDIPIGFYEANAGSTYKVATNSPNGVISTFVNKDGYMLTSQYGHTGGYYVVYADMVDSSSTLPADVTLRDIITAHSYTADDPIVLDADDFAAHIGTLPTDVADFEDRYDLGDGYFANKRSASIETVDNETTIDQYQYKLTHNGADVAYSNLYFEMTTVVNQDALAIKDLLYDDGNDLAIIDADDVYNTYDAELPEDLQTLQTTIRIADDYVLELIPVIPGTHEETKCEYVVVRDNESDVIYTGQYILDEVDDTLDETVLRAREVLNRKVTNGEINVGDVLSLDANELLVDILNTTVPSDISGLGDRYHLGNGIYAVKVSASNVTTRGDDTINGYVLNYNGSPVVFDTDVATTITSDDPMLDFIKTQIGSGYTDGDSITVSVADAYANATTQTAPTSANYEDYMLNIALADGYTLVLDYTEGTTTQTGIDAEFKLVNVEHSTANTGNYVVRELAAKSNGIFLKDNDLALSYHVYNTNGKITKTFNGSKENIFSMTTDNYLDITGKNYVTNKATQINFLKRTFGGVNLAGAQLIVKDNATNEVADTWWTTNTDHIVAGLRMVETLPTNKTDDGTFVLRETSAPAGYSVAPDRYFCIVGTVDTAETARVGHTVFAKDANGNPIYTPYVWYDTTENMEVSQLMATGNYESPRIDDHGNYIYENASGATIAKDTDGYFHTLDGNFIFADQDGNLLTVGNDGKLYNADGSEFVEDSTHSYHKVNSGYDDYTIQHMQSLKWTINKEGQLLLENTSTDNLPYRFVSRVDANGDPIAGAPVFPWEEDHVYQTDENGNDVLDSNGDRIEITVNVQTIALHDDTSIQIPDGFFGSCNYIWATDYVLSKVESVVTGGGWTAATTITMYDQDKPSSPDSPSPSSPSPAPVTPAPVAPKTYPVYVSKTMVTGGPELPGASLTIKDDKGNSVESWISTTQEHKVELVPGTYTLSERWAQTGFATGQDIQFTVYANNSVTHVTMVDEYTEVKISKKDITGEKELPGAVLTVTDESGDIVDQWVSGDKPHYINGKLEGGETYTLTEVASPNGYGYTRSVQFTVNKDNTCTQVHMVDTNVVKTDDPVNFTLVRKLIYGSILAILAAFGLAGVYFTSKNKKARVKADK